MDIIETIGNTACIFICDLSGNQYRSALLDHNGDICKELERRMKHVEMLIDYIEKNTCQLSLEIIDKCESQAEQLIFEATTIVGINFYIKKGDSKIHCSLSYGTFENGVYLTADLDEECKLIDISLNK